MATAATAIVKLVPEGTASVQGAFAKVGAVAEDMGRQGSTALRTVAQSAAGIVQTGKLGASSLATMLGQLGDLAVGFGAAGPLVGALSIAGGVLAKWFLDRQEEIKKTEQAAERAFIDLQIAGSSSGTLAEARKTIEDLIPAEAALADKAKVLADAHRSVAIASKFGTDALNSARAAERTAQSEYGDALAKVNALKAENAKYTGLAAKQIKAEAEQRERLAAAAKVEQAATPEGRAKALTDEVSALATLGKANKLTGDDIARLTALQDTLTAATTRGTAATRAAAQAELDKLNGVIGGSTGPRVNPLTAAFGGPATEGEINAQTDKSLGAQSQKLNSRIHVTVQGVIDQARAQAMLLRATLAETFSQGVASGMVDGIASGFQAAFRSGSIGEGFKALGASLLSGIGGAMVQFGEAALLASTLMQSIQAALQSFLPGAGIVASLAMIALGSALQALGGAASSSFGSMGSFASGGSAITSAPLPRPDDIMRVTVGPTSATTAAGMQPVQPIVFNVIGPNDPAAQRTIVKMVTNAQRRGLST